MTFTSTAPDVRRHRPLLALTAATTVLAVVAGFGIMADPRLLLGVPIWLKPFKFAVSFVLYGLTLAWMLAVLPRRSRVAERAATVVVGMAVAELVIIVTQTVRGVPSHFNVATPFDTKLWQAMGASIVLLFAAHLTIAVVAVRQRIPDRAAAYAIRLGLGLCLLGMLAAVPMMLRHPGIAGVAGAHSVGVPDGGPGLPLTGWSSTGGDLRIGHFVGLHALQALPLLAILLGRLARTRSWLGEAVRARLLLVAGAGYGVLVVLLTWQALRGQPLLRPDAATLAAAAGLAAAVGVAASVVLRGRSAARLG